MGAAVSISSLLPPSSPNGAAADAEDSEDGESSTDLPIRKNLIFPNEILEKIRSNLSFRDMLVARGVCKAWLENITEAGNLQDRVRIRVSSDELNHLVDTEPFFSSFYFDRVDLTRQSIRFWQSYSEIITHLDFYDCAIIPRNTEEDSNQITFSMGCPNLKHLGLINCDKYFLMGGQFIQLRDILCLKNLESLNLSQNNNLSDSILFSILLKTTRLRSIDLSNCNNLVFMKVVHERFYPKGSEDGPVEEIKFSENILSFNSLYTHFLNTERGCHMKEFNFGMRFNSIGLRLLLECENIAWEFANLETRELKDVEQHSFLDKFRTSLRGVKFGCLKLTHEHLFHLNLERLEELEIEEGRQSLRTLVFLSRMPNLRKLHLNCMPNLHLQHDSFQNLLNLTELSLNGLDPDEDRPTARKKLTLIFTHLKSLTSLSLARSSSYVNDEVLQEIIGSLRKLKRLNLQGAHITDVGMTGIDYQNQGLITTSRCLAELEELQHLNLDECRHLGSLSPLVWGTAINHINLVSLNLRHCQHLTRDGLLAIIDKCRNLEELNLLACPVRIVRDPDVTLAVQTKLPRFKELIF